MEQKVRMIIVTEFMNFYATILRLSCRLAQISSRIHNMAEQVCPLIVYEVILKQRRLDTRLDAIPW